MKMPSSSSSSSDQESYITEKKLRRREQNRKAAQRHREKLRREAMSVIEDYKKYKCANTRINQEVKTLEKEKEKLQKIISQHLKDQACCLRRNTHEFLHHRSRDSQAMHRSLDAQKQRQLLSDCEHAPEIHSHRVVVSERQPNSIYDPITAAKTGFTEFSSGCIQPADVSVFGSTVPERGGRRPDQGLLPAFIDLMDEQPSKGQGKRKKKDINASTATCTITKTSDDIGVPNDQSDTSVLTHVPNAVNFIAKPTTTATYIRLGEDSCRPRVLSKQKTLETSRGVYISGQGYSPDTSLYPPDPGQNEPTQAGAKGCLLNTVTSLNNVPNSKTDNIWRFGLSQNSEGDVYTLDQV